jgi:hypothetical protein
MEMTMEKMEQEELEMKHRPGHVVLVTILAAVAVDHLEIVYDHMMIGEHYQLFNEFDDRIDA